MLGVSLRARWLIIIIINRFVKMANDILRIAAPLMVKYGTRPAERPLPFCLLLCHTLF